MTARITGKLTLTNDCFRITTTDSESSHLLIWPAGFGVNVKNDHYQILDRNHNAIAQVGDNLCMSGGEITSAELASGYVQQLPAQCPGPYWIVGLEVRLNIRPSSDLIATQVITGGAQEFLIVRQNPALDKWDVKSSRLAGQILIQGRCPRIMTGAATFAPLWPSNAQAQIQNGAVEILDQTHQWRIRDGEQVNMGGGEIPVDWNLDYYQRLEKDMPCECGGPYWLVR